MQGRDGQPILIIGAGIGGLTAAIALRQRGFDVHVYERAPTLSEVGAGITLWYNALSALSALGIGDAIRAVGEKATGGVIGLASGRALVDNSPDDLLELGPAAELRAFHRADLQRALFEQLPSDSITFGAECTEVTPTGETANVHFETAAGRETHESWLVIGADGIHSRVRARLADDATRYAGYTCWRGICAVPSQWRGTCGEFWGVGDRFGVVRIPGERLYWFAVATAPEHSDSTPGESRKRALLERFASYAYDVPEILEATPADAIIFRDIIDRPPRRGWSEGCVTLLGDAAHPTTPNMGQGAAMAIESALVLARCLDESPDVTTALRLYEDTRYERTKWITDTSWSVGKMAHWENVMKRALRNCLFAWLPQSARLAQLRKVAAYDASSVPLAH